MPASTKSRDQKACYQREIPSANTLRTSLAAAPSSLLEFVGLETAVEGSLIGGSSLILGHNPRDDHFTLIVSIDNKWFLQQMDFPMYQISDLKKGH